MGLDNKLCRRMEEAIETESEIFIVIKSKSSYACLSCIPEDFSTENNSFRLSFSCNPELESTFIEVNNITSVVSANAEELMTEVADFTIVTAYNETYEISF